MPIFLKEKSEDPAKLGSSALETRRLKQLAVALQEQLKHLTAQVRRLKSEKRALEQQTLRQDSEMRQLKHELQRLKQRMHKKNVEHSDFGD